MPKFSETQDGGIYRKNRQSRRNTILMHIKSLYHQNGDVKT